jgi:heme/copper-type cytochrome/quinol oxidase subunit 2
MRKFSTALAVVVFSVVAFASAASAQTADPIGDAFSSGQTQLVTYVGLGIGTIVTLLLLGLGVTVLVKYLRKAGRAA